MTQSKLSALEKLAIEIAISAPVKQAKYSVHATVPWELIKEVRAELEKRGLDWRDMSARMVAIQDERRSKAGQGAS